MIDHETLGVPYSPCALYIDIEQHPREDEITASSPSPSLSEAIIGLSESSMTRSSTVDILEQFERGHSRSSRDWLFSRNRTLPQRVVEVKDSCIQKNHEARISNAKAPVPQPTPQQVEDKEAAHLGHFAINAKPTQPVRIA